MDADTASTAEAARSGHCVRTQDTAAQGALTCHSTGSGRWLQASQIYWLLVTGHTSVETALLGRGFCGWHNADTAQG